MSSLASPLPLPIIATGITLFCCIIYGFELAVPELTSNWALNPSLILQFELSRLTTYPLIHFSPLHLVFNMLALWPALAEFERRHGSLHTAIVMNTTGAVAGVVYTLITLVSWSNPDVSVGGASGWCFVFVTVACLQRSINSPTTTLYEGVSIPTKILPLVYLVLSQLLIPSSSFLGHVIGIAVGVAVFHGILGPLTTPPFQVLQKIEEWRPFLMLLSLKELFVYDGHNIFAWYYEKDCVDARYSDSPVLPVSSGDVLGTNSAQ